MSTDSDARAQLGNVLSVLPQKLHKIEYASSYDFSAEVPVSKNLLSLDSLGVGWLSADNPNYVNDGNLYYWVQIGGGSSSAGAASSSGGITISGVSGVGATVAAGAGEAYLDSSFLDVEIEPLGLTLSRLPGANPSLGVSDALSQSSNELVIMWTIPEGFQKGMVPFPSSFNIPSSTTPTIFTQFIASGDPTPSYITTVSDVTNTGFLLELSAQVGEPGQSMNILIKTNEPLEMVGVPSLPVGWDWFVLDTEQEIFDLLNFGQLLENSIYYSKDTNRMYILSSDTGELVYYQGNPV